MKEKETLMAEKSYSSFGMVHKIIQLIQTAVKKLSVVKKWHRLRMKSSFGKHNIFQIRIMYLRG